MGLLRSELMLHKKIRIPKDSAIEVMEEIGKLDDCIQFVDLNTRNYEQRKNFGGLIERCDESLRNIQNFENSLINQNLTINRFTTYEQFKIELEDDKENMKRTKKILGTTYFDLIENEIANNDIRLKELLQNYMTAAEDIEHLTEKKRVLDKCSELLLAQIPSDEMPYQRKTEIDFSGLESDAPVTQVLNLENRPGNFLLDDYSVSELNFISGVIKAEDDMKMKRMVFRASRGRALPTFFEFQTENKATQAKTDKKLFHIFIQGGAEENLANKIIKICEIFGASRYPIPKKNELEKAIKDVQEEIFNKTTYIKTVETLLKDFFRDKIGENGLPGKYDMYRLFFLQEKLLFTNLNKCTLRDNFIDGEVWIPQEKFPLVEDALIKMDKSEGFKLTPVFYDFDELEDKATPPTYLKLNDFTYPFQLIVSEYGVPRYREVNPGLFTIISFPFMFGVMFGDIGHGGLLLLLGIWLVLKKDEILKTMPSLKILVKTRYFFLFLGFFAFYNGWIYNDFFALPLGFFGSCYKNVKMPDGKLGTQRKENCVYPIGLDPKWHAAVNELAFLNSFKMKMSVIIGVLQMILGLILKGMNGIYYGDFVDFIFEFIPQFIFMCLLFGYMILMIYIKWGTDWSADTSKAPSIITQLLMIFLNGGSTGPEGYKTPLFHREDYTFQEKFQYYALIVSVICIPVMLLVKPAIEYFKLPKDEPVEEINNNINNNKGNNSAQKEEINKDQPSKVTLTDLAVNQIIETIEYVLGTVSHTASYLRLWALSLAHAQLAKVFFEITLLGFIQSGNIFGMLGAFFLLANITLGVLMGMDLLECSLHTLRLHWVEFQSKFYHADGIPFLPYSFKYINEEFL